MPLTYTSIADLVPNVGLLNAGVNFLFPARSTLITSGLVARGPEVDAVALGGPRKASVPFINALATDEVNYSTDDVNEQGNTGKLTGVEYMALRHDLNYGWAFADLVRMVTRYDLEGGIRAGIADYWNGVSEKIATNSIKGALASDAALTYGDGTQDFDMGEVYEGLADSDNALAFDTMIVHPVRMGKLRAAQVVAAPVAGTDTRFSTYQGFNLIESRAFGPDTTVVARSGALSFGFVDPTGLIPTEVERLPNGGNGGGAEVLHSRRSMVAHPQGFDFTGSSTPTAAALRDGANWARKADIENIGFRSLYHAA